ncbi:hypothetical protein E8E12_008806 [Didymella heteroderae]|uniref:Uncharacterized protein n=1 Tax=Didymella heteroderae TaxID=1769908 RepID=A0A9P4WR14_9PLEO|nr:hypothetical protein E8E12_008806 [Didymella heteroderae]
MSTLLSIPRELREAILHHLTLSPTVYTSSASAGTIAPQQTGSRKPEETFVDSRIYLPSRPPANLLSTCRQLRQESLELHSHLLNFAAATRTKKSTTETTLSIKAAEMSGVELDEAAERSSDDGVTLRLTLEVQRPRRNAFGFSVPARVDPSPRFLALLPLMKDARKLKMVVWPGFDWWNGPAEVSPLELWRQRKAFLKCTSADQVGHTQQQSETGPSKISNAVPKLDAVTVAVGKILNQLPAVEELDLSLFIATGDLFRWDLPDIKWAKIQPWLDAPISKTVGKQLRKVSTSLTSVWQWPESELASQQPFYVQKETRSDVESNRWRVARQAGWRAPMFEHLAHLAALELPDTIVNEIFERIDA